MSDERGEYYCYPYHVGQYYKPGKAQTAVALNSTSTTNTIPMALADTADFYIGGHVRLYDDAKTHGEVLQVQSITENGATSYLETVETISATYTSANNASVELLGPFTLTGNPRVEEVNDMIEDAMAEIDRYTRTAWREVSVTEEFHNMPMGYYNPYKGRRIALHFRPIIVDSDDGLDSTESDSLKIYSSGSWTDWATSKTAGRGNDYWIDGTYGILYIQQLLPVYRIDAIRISYRYGSVDSSGKPNPPKDIRKACAKLVAAELLEMEPTLAVHPGGGDLDAPKPQDRAEKIRDDAYRILEMYKEIPIA